MWIKKKLYFLHILKTNQKKTTKYCIRSSVKKIYKNIQNWVNSKEPYKTKNFSLAKWVRNEKGRSGGGGGLQKNGIWKSRNFQKHCVFFRPKIFLENIHDQNFFRKIHQKISRKIHDQKFSEKITPKNFLEKNHDQTFSRKNHGPFKIFPSFVIPRFFHCTPKWKRGGQGKIFSFYTVPNITSLLFCFFLFCFRLVVNLMLLFFKLLIKWLNLDN